MLRPIDHLVLPVESLGVARARYEQMGFRVQGNRQHPFGTANCCIMFGNKTYLEPLAVTSREDFETALLDGNLFVRRTDGFRFRHGEGIAMLALKSSDAASDQAEFSRLGYGRGDVLGFERDAELPDGSMQKIGVRISHAIDHRAPDCMVFTCQHLNEDVLWTSDNIVHKNGSVGVVQVILSEPNPADFQYYLEGTTGQRNIRASSTGVEADTGSGRISILTPFALGAIYGVDIDGGARGLRLRGFTIHVSDLDRLGDLFDENSVIYRRIGSGIIVDAAPGQGAFIVFEEGPS